jgi:hypothetical protein
MPNPANAPIGGRKPILAPPRPMMNATTAIAANQMPVLHHRVPRARLIVSELFIVDRPFSCRPHR